MALIVETGGIIAGADSYVSITEADTYHERMGNTAWEALDDVDDKEPALRRAVAFMQQMYRGRWKGNRVSALQALDWPRAGVLDEDGPYAYGYGSMLAITTIPQELKDAQSELALRAYSAALAPDLERAVMSETVGPISVTYDASSPESTRYRSIDATLGRYLQGSPMNIQLRRS